ncbi:MAG: TetR/AcrR family transcriptional regulator [Pseudomonadota bacterium]
MPKTKTVSLPSVRPYHHGDLRNALVQAGVGLLAEAGVHALSLREVARRAGVSATAPYRHFESKDSLLAAIAEEGFITLIQMENKAMAQFPGDPLLQIRAKSTAYINFCLSHPEHMRIMFGGILAKPDTPESLRQKAGEAFSTLKGLISACQQNGHFRKRDIDQQALTWWATGHGLAMIMLNNCLPQSDAPKDCDGLMQWVVEPMLEGFMV